MPVGAINGILPLDAGDPQYFWTTRNYDVFPFLP